MVQGVQGFVASLRSPLAYAFDAHVNARTRKSLPIERSHRPRAILTQSTVRTLFMHKIRSSAPVLDLLRKPSEWRLRCLQTKRAAACCLPSRTPALSLVGFAAMTAGESTQSYTQGLNWAKQGRICASCAVDGKCRAHTPWALNLCRRPKRFQNGLRFHQQWRAQCGSAACAPSIPAGVLPAAARLQGGQQVYQTGTSGPRKDLLCLPWLAQRPGLADQCAPQHAAAQGLGRWPAGPGQAGGAGAPGGLHGVLIAVTLQLVPCCTLHL